MVTTTLIDTHAHLDFPEFASDLPAVIQRAREAGVTRIITIGTDLDSSRRAVELAGQFPEVFAAVGWHPGHAEEATEDFRDALRSLASHPKVVAIGECGLDFYRLPSRVSGGTPADDERVRIRQATVFQQQLEIAAELGLNVVIHTRDSWTETVAQFEPFANRVRGVFHCFGGTPPQVNQVVSLNSLVSFTGILTFKNGDNVRASLAATPSDRFMLETDCPYLAPVPHRGKRCEPGFVREIAATASQVTGRSIEEISALTEATALSFFRGLK